MTDQKRYQDAVETQFHYLYKAPFYQVLTEVIERIRLSGYTVADCAVALFRGLEHEAREAEKRGK